MFRTLGNGKVQEPPDTAIVYLVLRSVTSASDSSRFPSTCIVKISAIRVIEDSIAWVATVTSLASIGFEIVVERTLSWRDGGIIRMSFDGVVEKRTLRA